MRKVLTRALIPLSALLVLPACVSAPVSVTARAAGCTALLPEAWRQPVEAPEFSGEGTVVGDWISFADALAGRLDQANDRTVSSIQIVSNCEARDQAAVDRATRRKFLGLF